MFASFFLKSMTIQFNISHDAPYGEEVLLNVLVNDDEGNTRAVALDMRTSDGQHWTYKLNNIDRQNQSRIDYFFSTTFAGHERMREWTGITHRLDLNITRCENLNIHNVWHNTPENVLFYSYAYTECKEPRPISTPSRCLYTKTLRLIVRAPKLRFGERLFITGKGKAFGEWNIEKAIAMTEHNTGEWQADINAIHIGHEAEFRFFAVDKDGTMTNENGANRIIDMPHMQMGDMVVFELPEADVDIPCPEPNIIYASIANLRCADSFGVGDFGDLASFISNVARKASASVVRITPTNDTQSTNTAADASPHSIISVYALHPLLCDIRQLPTIEDACEQQRMEALRHQLNALPYNDYLATLEAKLDYMHIAFVQEGDHIMHSAAFKQWFAANEYWLVPYAQYSYLREAYNQPNFRIWPNHNEWTEAERGQLQNPRTKAYKKLAFYYYVQYILHTQLCRVHTIARDNGIVLMGDLTAIINPNGCDVWQEQGNVGTDHWWTRRLKAAKQYYDACFVTADIAKRQRVADATRMWMSTNN